MRVGTLIKHRTQEKEIRLSKELVMTKAAWEARGGIYHDTVGRATKNGWYTVRVCERMGLPATDEEFQNCKDFAMFAACYAENFIVEDGKQKVPCLPVFYRDKKDIWVRLRVREPDGTWSEPCDCTSLETAEFLLKTQPAKYKWGGYFKVNN